MAEPNEKAMPDGMGQSVSESKESPIDVSTPETTNGEAVTPSEKRTAEKELGKTVSAQQDVQQDKTKQEAPAADEQSPEKNAVRRGRPPKAEKIEKESKQEKSKKVERSARPPKGPKEVKQTAGMGEVIRTQRRETGNTPGPCYSGTAAAERRYPPRRNRITLTQHKTGRPLILPLLEDVGTAIIDYLKFGRPKCGSPEIFIRHFPPVSPFVSKSLYSMVAGYIGKSGLLTRGKKRGPHALRHSLASRLLEENVPLPVISEILGHANTNTTSAYLVIDINKLRACALEV